MTQKRDKTLFNIVSLVRENKILLEKLGSPGITQLFQLDKFEVELNHSLSACQDKPIMFDFWKTEEKDELSVRLLDNESSFIIYEENRRTVLEDSAGLKIEEYVNESFPHPRYPHFQSTWTGEETGYAPKGTLTFFRIDFSGSIFVSYYYNKKGLYDVFNPTEADLAELGLPEDLNASESVLGQSILKKIDFDAKKAEIFKRSGLEELNEEIKLLTA